MNKSVKKYGIGVLMAIMVLALFATTITGRLTPDKVPNLSPNDDNSSVDASNNPTYGTNNPGGIFARGNVPTGYDSSTKGTAISTIAQLAAWLDNPIVNAYLTDNITMPITSMTSNAQVKLKTLSSGATLDGCGYNITINGGYGWNGAGRNAVISFSGGNINCLGFLFSRVDGNIKNLNVVVTNSFETNHTYHPTVFGIIAGYLSPSGVIENTSVVVNAGVNIKLHSDGGNRATGLGGMVGIIAGTITGNSLVTMNGYFEVQSGNAQHSAVGGFAASGVGGKIFYSTFEGSGTLKTNNGYSFLAYFIGMSRNASNSTAEFCSTPSYVKNNIINAPVTLTPARENNWGYALGTNRDISSSVNNYVSQNYIINTWLNNPCGGAADNAATKYTLTAVSTPTNTTTGYYFTYTNRLDASNYSLNQYMEMTANKDTTMIKSAFGITNTTDFTGINKYRITKSFTESNSSTFSDPTYYQKAKILPKQNITNLIANGSAQAPKLHDAYRITSKDGFVDATTEFTNIALSYAGNRTNSGDLFTATIPTTNYKGLAGTTYAVPGDEDSSRVPENVTFRIISQDQSYQFHDGGAPSSYAKPSANTYPIANASDFALFLNSPTATYGYLTQNIDIPQTVQLQNTLLQNKTLDGCGFTITMTGTTNNLNINDSTTFNSPSQTNYATGLLFSRIYGTFVNAKVVISNSHSTLITRASSFYTVGAICGLLEGTVENVRVTLAAGKTFSVSSTAVCDLGISLLAGTLRGRMINCTVENNGTVSAKGVANSHVATSAFNAMPQGGNMERLYLYGSSSGKLQLLEGGSWGSIGMLQGMARYRKDSTVFCTIPSAVNGVILDTENTIESLMSFSENGYITGMFANLASDGLPSYVSFKNIYLTTKANRGYNLFGTSGTFDDRKVNILQSFTSNGSQYNEHIVDMILTYDSKLKLQLNYNNGNTILWSVGGSNVYNTQNAPKSSGATTMTYPTNTTIFGAFVFGTRVYISAKPTLPNPIYNGTAQSYIPSDIFTGISTTILNTATLTYNGDRINYSLAGFTVNLPLPSGNTPFVDTANRQVVYPSGNTTTANIKIEKRSVNITPKDGLSMEFSGANPPESLLRFDHEAANGNSGLLTGHSLTGNLLLQSQSFALGQYAYANTLSPNIQFGSSSYANNYTLMFTNAANYVFTITKKGVIINFNAFTAGYSYSGGFVTRQYNTNNILDISGFGGNVPTNATVGSYSSVNFQLKASATTDILLSAATVGQRNITISSQEFIDNFELSGTDAAYYYIKDYTYSSSSTNIDKVNITAVSITVSGLSANEKTYDGVLNNVVINDTNKSFSGAFASDLSTLSLNSANLVGTITNRNVGNSIPVSVSLVLSGESAINYSLAMPTYITVSVKPATVTITIDDNQSKIYDRTATTPTISYVVSNKISDDTIDGLISVNYNGSFTVGTAYQYINNLNFKHNNVNINSNYIIQFNTANKTFAVTRREISATSLVFENANFQNGKYLITYFGNTTLTPTDAAFTARSGDTGLIVGDSLRFIFNTATMSSKDIGTNTISTNLAINDTDTDAQNYRFVQPSSSSLLAEVTKLNIYVLLGVQDKQFDDTNIFVPSQLKTRFVSVESGNANLPYFESDRANGGIVFGFGNNTVLSNSPYAGEVNLSNYANTIVSISGHNLKNYNYATAQGNINYILNAKGTITKRDVQFNYTLKSKEFDGTNTAKPAFDTFSFRSLDKAYTFDYFEIATATFAGSVPSEAPYNISVTISFKPGVSNDLKNSLTIPVVGDATIQGYITKRNVSINATFKSNAKLDKEYDGNTSYDKNNLAFGVNYGFTLPSPFLYTIEYTTTVSFNSKNVANANQLNIQYDLQNNSVGLYIINSIESTTILNGVSIKAKQLSLTDDVVLTSEFNNSPQQPAIQNADIIGLIGTETVNVTPKYTVDGVSTAAISVGKYSFEMIIDSTNYFMDNVNYIITKAIASVKITLNTIKTYISGAVSITIDYVNSDGVFKNSAVITYTFLNDTVTPINAGTYRFKIVFEVLNDYEPVSRSQITNGSQFTFTNDADNTDITYVEGNFTVNPAVATITQMLPDASELTYDAEEKTATYTVVGINPDIVGLNISDGLISVPTFANTAEFKFLNAKTYDLTITLRNANYKLESPFTSTFTYEKRKVTFNNTTIFDNANAQFIYAKTSKATSVNLNNTIEKDNVAAIITYNTDDRTAPMNVGSYIASVNLSNTSNYELSGDNTISFSIIQKSVRVSFTTLPNSTYTGGEMTIFATPNNDDLCFGDILGFNTTDNSFINVGNYTAKSSITNPNYVLYGANGDNCVTQNWEIIQRKVAVEFSNYDLIYNGNSQSVTTTLKNAIERDNLTPIITYNSGSNLPKDAKHYIIAVTIDNNNYVLDGLTSLEFNVAPFDISAAISFAGKTITFDNTYKGLTLSFDTSIFGGSIEANGLPIGVNLKSALPLYKNAQTYTINAQFTLDTNFTQPSDYTVSADLIILKKKVNLGFGQTRFEYAKENKSISVNVANSAYDLTPNIEYTQNGTPVSPFNAGSYDVTVSIGDTNHEIDGVSSSTLVILPKSMNISFVLPIDMVYNNTVKTLQLQTSGIISGDNVIISKNNDANTDAGNYTANAKIGNPNYSLTDADSDGFIYFNYKISQRKLGLTFSDYQNLTFKAEMHEVKYAFNNAVTSLDSSIYYSKNGTDLESAPSNAGSYTATVIFNNENYVLDDSNFINFDIAPKSVSLTYFNNRGGNESILANNAVLGYSGSVQNIMGYYYDINHDKTYLNDTNNYVNFSNTPLNAGYYVADGIIDTNYTSSDSMLSFSIAPKVITVDYFLGDNFEYNSADDMYTSKYDGQRYFFNASPNGIFDVDNDKVNLNVMYGDSNSYILNAGVYTLSTTCDNSNYKIDVAQNLVRVKVFKASLTILVNNLEILVGQTPSFVYNYIGFVGNDNYNNALLTKPNVNGEFTESGVYAVVARGASSLNYEISYGQSSDAGKLKVYQTKLKDIPSDIQISGVFDPEKNLSLIVTENNDASIMSFINSALKQNTNTTYYKLNQLYDISMYSDSIKVQPDSTIVIRIKLSTSQLNKSNYKVVHYKDNGNIEILSNVTVADGYIEFETDSLSHFGILFSSDYSMLIILISAVIGILIFGLFFELLRRKITMNRSR